MGVITRQNRSWFVLQVQVAGETGPSSTTQPIGGTKGGARVM